jgi:hypothetical protein
MCGLFSNMFVEIKKKKKDIISQYVLLKLLIPQQIVQVLL